jgi:transcriptional regulator of PTS gene
VRVANEVQAAARGELRFGAARGLASAVYLHVGRGIGAGLVADGRVVAGEHGTAGELGHVRAGASGALCHCGASGCLEAECSPEAVVAEARRALAGGVASSLAAADPDALTFEDVAAAAGGGDRLARNLVERMGEEIGQALAGLVNVFDPETVLLAAGLDKGVLAEAVGRGFDARVLPALRGAVRVAPAALGRDAALLGAADLVFDLVFSDGRAAR